jgi:magnesium-transporting ATPase (P-type)
LSKWPLFGSSFFAVKRVSDPKERSDHILALNRHGVHFIDLITHVSITCAVSHFVSEYVQIWSQNNMIRVHIRFLNKMSSVDLRTLCYSVPCTEHLVSNQWCLYINVGPCIFSIPYSTLVLFVTYKCNFPISFLFCHRLNREHLVYGMLVLTLQ